MLKKLLSAAGIVALFLMLNAAITPKPASAATTSLTSLQAGDLIRGQAFNAVYYYGADGFRYVFPNDKTYFTWYANFDNIKWLTDADLGTIQIGGNVTYKPGVKMIKINSDPKTYAVGENGSLHWVTTEAVAIALYGTNWNTKIDDVPDGFFSNYQAGPSIEVTDDFVPSEETAGASNINDDKDLKSPTVVHITDNAYSKTSVTIDAGTVVRFENDGVNKHTATADDLSWGSGTISPNGNFSRYFKTAGTYEYFDSYYPTTMTATIVVE